MPGMCACGNARLNEEKKRKGVSLFVVELRNQHCSMSVDVPLLDVGC
ncbi:MAG TPA: hypothetical protein VIF82_02005 [Burkholderiaceae bacterium]|jgi:hypothetical protein